MKKLLVLTILGAAGLAFAAADPVFMGIKMGAPFGAGSLPSCDDPKEDLCIKSFKPPVASLGKVPVHGLHASALLLLSPDGRAQDAAFSGGSAEFQAIKTALTERFGKPSSADSSEVQNAAGAKFDQELVTWSVSTMQITLRKRNPRNLNELSLRVFDRNLDAERMKRVEDANKSQSSKF